MQDLGERRGTWLRERKDFKEVIGVQVRLMLLQHSLGKHSC